MFKYFSCGRSPLGCLKSIYPVGELFFCRLSSEFVEHSDLFLQGSPARIILVVGGELDILTSFCVLTPGRLIIRSSYAQCRARVGQRRVKRSFSKGVWGRTFIEWQYVEGGSRSWDTFG